MFWFVAVIHEVAGNKLLLLRKRTRRSMKTEVRWWSGASLGYHELSARGVHGAWQRSHVFFSLSPSSLFFFFFFYLSLGVLALRSPQDIFFGAIKQQSNLLHYSLLLSCEFCIGGRKGWLCLSSTVIFSFF